VAGKVPVKRNRFISSVARTVSQPALEAKARTLAMEGATSPTCPTEPAQFSGSAPTGGCSGSSIVSDVQHDLAARPITTTNASHRRP